MPGTAFAFSAPEAYFEAAGAGGGGGRWFTGSQADGFGCSVCHGAEPSQRTFPLYLTGLPGRYVPEQQYDVQLSWPEFSQRYRELRPDPTLPPLPEAPFPNMGLVGELVAQSGEGSGTIEIGVAPPVLEELCESVSANIRPRLAVRLYQVRAGVAPLLIRPDEDGVLRCESRQLAQRCIMAMISCGAQQVRFRWTAPPQYEGTLWFSAGFVASEALSGTTAGDSVFESTVPVIPASSPTGFYQESLENASCAVAGAGRRPTHAVAAWPVFAALVWWRTRRRGRRR
jgi:hypothetical protein